MKRLIKLTALATIMSIPAVAGTNYQKFCGPDHPPGRVKSAEVKVNADGYFIVNTSEQISIGDPRIVQTSGKDVLFCTEMVMREWAPHLPLELMVRTQGVKYLFIPSDLLAETPES